MYTLKLDVTHIDFLRELLNTPGLNVPVKAAKIASEVFDLLMTATPDGPPLQSSDEPQPRR